MKFRITRSGDYEYDKAPIEDSRIKHERPMIFSIEINSLEELMDLMRRVDHPLVITLPSPLIADGLPEIEIYDSCRE
jgi:hypothetical protein